MLATRAMMRSPESGSAFPQTGLVHHWRLNDGSGSAVTDLGSGSAAGTIIDNLGDPLSGRWFYDSGLGRDVYSGDQTSGLKPAIDIPGLSVSGTNFSIVSHFQRPKVQGDSEQIFFDCETPRIYCSYYDLSSNPRLRTHVDGSTSNVANNPTIGTWYQLVLTVNITTGAVASYIDGSQIGSLSSGTGASLASPFRLGNVYLLYATDYSFHGYLTDSMIYTRILSTADMATIRTASLG